MKKPILLLVLIVISTLVFGCGSQDTIKTDEGTINVKDDTIEFQSENGKSELTVSEEGDVALPEGYPEDIVPIMEGSKITLAGKDVNENKEEVYSVIMTSKEEFGTIQTYYQDVLKDAQELQKYEANGVYSIFGSKAGKSFAININEDESNRVINITIAPME